MTYIPVPPNAYDSGLIPQEVAHKYFEEYFNQTPISDFMGTSAMDIIQVKEVMQGHGTTVPFALMRDIDDENVVIGAYQQMRGNEQSIKTVTDKLMLEQYRHADTLKGIPFIKQQTPLDLFGQLRPALIKANKKLLTKSVFFSATNGTDTFKGPYYDVVNTKPSFDRIKITGSTANRVAYNGYAGLTRALNELPAGKAYNQGGLSVALIRSLRIQALSGSGDGVYEAETRITPTEVSTKHGFPVEKHVLLIDPLAYESLVTDPSWASMMYQGMIRGQYQPESITGSRFRGEVEGVYIYECEELSRHRINSQAGNKVGAWGLFLGAQAFGMAWGQKPSFASKWIDYDQNYGICVSEIRGVKSLMFPSDLMPGSSVERGIIHLFTSV